MPSATFISVSDEHPLNTHLPMLHVFSGIVTDSTLTHFENALDMMQTVSSGRTTSAVLYPSGHR